MSLAVYAIVGRAGTRPGMRGVANEPLRVIRVAALGAIVGEVKRPPRLSEANLRKFASLMARLAAAHPAILPARFGTTMRDLDELEMVLGARQKPLRQQLAHVRGRVQMTTRVVVSGRAGERKQAAARKKTGAEYLRVKAAAQHASTIPEFAPLQRAVARWVKDERVERKNKVVTVYHLVPARCAVPYADAIEDAALASGARGFVSGPWPPYAFADTW